MFSMRSARGSMATGVVYTQLLLFQLCAVVVERQVSSQRTDGSTTATFFFSGIPFMLSFVRSFFYIADK